jgi:hypothetical protein
MEKGQSKIQCVKFNKYFKSIYISLPRDDKLYSETAMGQINDVKIGNLTS